MEGRTVGKAMRGRRRLQMLEDLYQNNGYEVMKRKAEDRSARKESTTKKVPKTAVQQTTEEEQEES